jgi:hypothetical protein
MFVLAIYTFYYSLGREPTSTGSFGILMSAQSLIRVLSRVHSRRRCHETACCDLRDGLYPEVAKIPQPQWCIQY